MKKQIFYLLAFVLPLSFAISGFSNGKDVLTDPPAPTGETAILLEFLEANRNFINTDEAPALVTADEVKKNLKNEKYHIIDIRSDSWFDYGHLKDANNVKSSDLLSYFENNIVPTDYEKIVLICYSGQSAAHHDGISIR